MDETITAATGCITRTRVIQTALNCSNGVMTVEDAVRNARSSTAYAQKIIDRDTKWLYMKCAVLATLWFVLSASLALYNKAIFSKKGFPAPLLYTSCQFFMQWLLATWALSLIHI